MRNIFRIVLAILGVVQNALARPDFAMNADVVGSGQAMQTASSLINIFGALNDYTILLGSNYDVIYMQTDALYSVAGNVTAKGTAISESLSLLAEDDSGITGPPYLAATTATAEMLALIRTGLTQEFETLRTRGKLFITDMLTDSFDYIDETLTNLDDILREFQTAAENAQAASGGEGALVLSEVFKQLITPQLTNSMLNVVDRIPGAMSPLLYSVHYPLSQQDQGDTFISKAKGDIEQALFDSHMEVVKFNGNLRQLKQETFDNINSLSVAYLEIQTQVVSLLPTLQSSTTFTKKLDGALDTYDDTMSEGSFDDKTFLLEEAITNYLSQSTTFDDDLLTVYDARICPPLKHVVQVVIASGPYASYCFEKYAHKVVDLAVHNFYDIGECYELELNRLYSMHRLIYYITDLVLFSFSELFDNLNTCISNHTCPGTCDSCIDTVGSFLTTLSQLMDEKFEMILQIIPYETDASLQRLKSCVAFSKYKLIADAHDLSQDIFTCEDTGYN